MKTTFTIIYTIITIFVNISVAEPDTGYNRILSDPNNRRILDENKERILPETKDKKVDTDLTPEQKKIAEDDAKKDKLPSSTDEAELEKLKKQMQEQGIVGKNDSNVGLLFVSSMIFTFFIN